MTMRNVTPRFFLLLLFIGYLFPAYGQDTPGIIINELGNLSGSCCTAAGNEYIELLVIGDDSNPTANVDLTGWIIDDNNGDFESLGGSVGIANGHLRLESSCFSSIPPGSIILIYNDGGTCTTPGPANDETDSNTDNVYVFPVSSTCLSICDRLPCNGTACPGGGSASSAYSPCSLTTSGGCKWATVGLRNGGDAVQARKPDGTFYHGFSWDDVDTVFPDFPNTRASFNAGSQDDFSFNICANATLSTAFNSISTSPGASNSADNTNIINAIQAGTISYNQLLGSGLPVDCDALLPVSLLQFDASLKSNGVALDWVTSSEFSNSHFIILRSQDGKNYEKLAKIKGTGYSNNFSAYTFFDDAPNKGINYYRLKQVDFSGQFAYSKIQPVRFYQKTLGFTLGPVPAQSNITIRLDEAVDQSWSFEVFNAAGALVVSNTDVQDAQEYLLNIDALPVGSYWVRVYTNQQSWTAPFVKQY